MIQFDCETNGLQWPYHRAFLYQFGDDDGLVEVLEPENRERIQWWFDRSRDEGLMAWNSKFDLAFALNDNFELPPEDQWHDGMLVAHAIDENRSVALKAVSRQLFGEGADDLQKQLKKWLSDERARRKKVAKEAEAELIEPTYADVPRDIMEPYAAEDIVLTKKVWDVYKPRLEQSADLNGIVEFERKDLAALFAVERRGFPVDAEGYRRLEIEVIENLERLETECETLAAPPKGTEFNPRSSKQILDALKRRDADLSFVTNESMDAENLRTVHDELAEKILEFRSEFKVLSTYVRPMIGRSYATSLRAWKEPFITPAGRVHTNYRQVAAKTGRMGSSDPNIQNQPRDDLRLRFNFRAEPGMALVCCDLSNIEMRVFAAYAGEGKMLDAILNGDDMHVLTAESIGLRDRARPGGHIESARQRGKEFNFQMLYGGGLRTIRKSQRCNMDTARLFHRRYHDTYPEVGRLQNRIEWKLQDNGFIRSAWGRRFRMSPNEAYKAVNYLVQGTAADLLKASLIRLHGEGVPIVACVHDELIAHVPIAEAEDVKAKIESALTEHPRITDKVPLEADGVIVQHWSDAKPLKDGSFFVPGWAER